MTNQNLLDELARLTDRNSMEERQAISDAFRPKNRHPVAKGKGHLTIKERTTRTGTRQDGTTYDTDVVVMRIDRLSNVEVARGRDPYTESYMEFDVPWSDRLMSQMGQMVAQSGVDNIVELNDKDVAFEDYVAKAGKDRNGYDIMIWAYKCTVLGSGSTTIKSDPDITFDDFTSTENETLLSHLAGNNLQAFLQQAVKLGLDPKKQSFVVQRKWSQEAVKRGMAEEIDGVFQVRF